jgi:hypothetical protein
MSIFIIYTLQKKWTKIHMKQLALGNCIENDCFLRTLKFEMLVARIKQIRHTPRIPQILLVV